MVDLPKFDNPPVVEVVAGLTFPRIQALQAPHFGAFWLESLGGKESFPHIISNPPSVSQLSFEALKFDNLPLPRVWFLNKSKSQLVQMQQECFYFNWKKSEEAPKYPSYSDVIRNFENYYGLFEKLLESLDLGRIEPKSLELTYVNVIEFPEETEKADLVDQAIKYGKWESTGFRFLDRPTGMADTLTFDIAELSASLRITFATGQNNETGRPVLRITNTVQGDWQPNDSFTKIRQWYDVAHKWIVLAFDDFTTPKMHAKWKKLELE